MFTDRQADLVQRYTNGRPQSVTVYTTPYNRFSYVNYDLGIYAQDSWTIKRLTLNPGVRIDNFDSKIEATSMQAGRFAGDRYFPERASMFRSGCGTCRLGSAPPTISLETAGRR